MGVSPGPYAHTHSQFQPKRCLVHTTGKSVSDTMGGNGVGWLRVMSKSHCAESTSERVCLGDHSWSIQSIPIHSNSVLLIALRVGRRV